MKLLSHYRWSLLWLLLPVGLGLAFMQLQREWYEPPALLPDMRAIDQVDERKTTFVEFLLPLIDERNQTLLAERERLARWHSRYLEQGQLSRGEVLALQRLANRKRLEYAPQEPDFWLTLDRRLDRLPPSLVLAQAAKESGWGQSRFAREGNNLFGQWCFQEGCGIVPGRRAAGRSHEVASFDHPRQAVASYFRNLNTHPTYSDLRKQRQRARWRGELAGGIELASGLLRYSERGQVYVDEVRSLIRQNQFQDLDAEMSPDPNAQLVAIVATGSEA